MANKKAPKPLFPLKQDFFESLSNFVDKSMLLKEAVRSALDVQAIPNQGVAEMLRRRLADLDAAMFEEGED